MAVRFLILLLLAFTAGSGLLVAREEEKTADAGLKEMTWEHALEILNESQWSRQLTVTRVISGVGSGEYGEKEIFSRFYVRLLSAAPIQQAYQRLKELVGESETDAAGYDSVSLVPLTDDRFLVIGVAFRSNQPDQEAEVLNALRSQTLETLKSRTYLNTSSFPQVQLVAYHPPSELAVGAQFVFPRVVGGQGAILAEDDTFAFELDLPGVSLPRLRVTFPVTPEVLAEDLNERAAPRASESITEFRIDESRSSDSVNLEASRLAGVVNLFPSQQRGSFLHGSVYEYHRNDNLDARNFFDPVNEPLPEFKRNQFGFSLGVELGPRLDLFGYYDGLRISKGSTLLSNVPSQAMRSGDFRELFLLETPVQLVDPLTGLPFPNNRIPPERIHPVAQNLLPLIPGPNRFEEVRNFVNSQPQVQDQDSFSLRADYGLSSLSQLSGQFATRNGGLVEVHPFPAFGTNAAEREYEASISYTRTFGDNTVASVRAEFDRSEELETPRDERPAGLLESLGIDGVKTEGPEDEGYPVFELDGYPGFGDERLPQHEVENRYELEGEVTIGRGSHILTLRGSGGLRELNDSRSNSLERGEFGFSGTYSGHAFADFMLGRAANATRAVGTSRQDLRSRSFQVSALDEWRVNDRMTVSFGLGYQYWQPFGSLRDNISVFRPLLFEPPTDGTLVDLADGKSSPQTVVGRDFNNFSPRIGLALRPFGGGRFVLRASYRVSYDPVPSWLFENYMGRNYPYYYLQNAQASTDSSGLDIGAPFNTDTATELGVRDITPDLRTPYEQGWDLSLQNQLSDNWNLDFTFRGRRSLKEFRVIPANVPVPGTGAIQARRPNPEYGPFSLVTAGGSSLFYEFQIDLRRRFSDGFTFDTTVELRRSFDDDFSSFPSDPRNLRAEWAPSDGFQDRRIRLNFIYDLPFGAGRKFGAVPGLELVLGGWRLSGIGELSSGRAFTVELPGDFNNDGLSNDRPDRLSSGRLPSDERSIDRWFDTAAFVEPEPLSFGDSGRNILMGPPYHNWDMSLIKDFIFRNDHRFQVRFAFFNAFNHPNFEAPNAVYGTRTFGVITGAERAREIEIALKYSF